MAHMGEIVMVVKRVKTVGTLRATALGGANPINLRSHAEMLRRNAAKLSGLTKSLYCLRSFLMSLNQVFPCAMPYFGLAALHCDGCRFCVSVPGAGEQG